MKGCGQPWANRLPPLQGASAGKGRASAEGPWVLEQLPPMKAPQEVDGQ